jgi:hypothetical protein
MSLKKITKQDILESINKPIDLNEIDKEIKKLNDYKTNFTKIIRLQNIINDSNRVTPVIEREFRNIRPFIKTNRLDRMYHEALGINISFF